MAAKAVENARELTRQVANGLRKYALPAALNIDDELDKANARPYGLSIAVDVAATRLEEAFASYEQSDAAIISEADQDHSKRMIQRKLRVMLSVLNGAVDSCYGWEGLECLRLEGPTPVPAERLLAKTKCFLDATTDGIPDLPEPKQMWSIPDIATARLDIAKVEPQLEQALSEISARSTSTREAKKARVTRDQLAVEWYRELRFGANLARSLLLRANQDDLAATRLPTERQIGRVEPDDPPLETA